MSNVYPSSPTWQNLRHFNQLAGDRRLGLLTKTSDRKDQLRHQVRWFRLAPGNLASFLPRIQDSSDGEEPFITMEWLDLPTLAELFMAATLPPEAWLRIVNRLRHILAEMACHPGQRSGAAEMAGAMYADKTRDRLLEFVRGNPRSAAYHVLLAGRRVDLMTVLTQLDRFVDQAGLLNIDRPCAVHGDFCFSNILLAVDGSAIKMIDPRGEFGRPGIDGDPRYDLAKLAHSFSGGYDFIVADRFSVKVEDDGELSFKSGMKSCHAQIAKIFSNVLLSDPLLAQQVKVIEALLFLSMLPLHADQPKRQLAMLATGLTLFGQCQSKMGS
jgi:hypothetical protein